jgi:hypothetical protein
VAGALPRARAVPRVRALAGDDEVLAALGAPEFAPESLALTTEAGAAGEYAPPGRVRVAFREDTPDRVELAVESPARAFVVLADAWSAGWRASVDGAPAPLRRVDHVLRGVAVPAGRHALRFAYAPPGVRAGAWSSRLAWAAALALAALALASPGARLRLSNARG